MDTGTNPPEAIYFPDECHEHCWKRCGGDHQCYRQCMATCEEEEAVAGDWIGDLSEDCEDCIRPDICEGE